MTTSDNLKFRFATDGEGNYGYLGADDSFVPFKSGGVPEDVYTNGKTNTFTAQIGEKYLISFGGHSRDTDLTGKFPNVTGANIEFTGGIQTNEGYKSSSGSQARYYSNLSIMIVTATSTKVKITLSNLSYPCIIVCKI